MAEWYSPDKANVKTRVWVLRTKKLGGYGRPPVTLTRTRGRQGIPS